MACNGPIGSTRHPTPPSILARVGHCTSDGEDCSTFASDVVGSEPCKLSASQQANPQRTSRANKSKVLSGFCAPRPTELLLNVALVMHRLGRARRGSSCRGNESLFPGHFRGTLARIVRHWGQFGRFRTRIRNANPRKSQVGLRFGRMYIARVAQMVMGKVCAYGSK